MTSDLELELSDRLDRLDQLRYRIEEDPHFAHLRQPGINYVPGSGNVLSTIMVVGEAPGATENGRRRPFCGPSGRVLDQLIECAGWAREEVYTTNVLKYRPPGNRTPTFREVECARDHLREEWAIIQPRLTVAVGGVAHMILRGPLAGKVSSELARGVLEPFAGGWVVSSYHPAYGLRNPSVRGAMERNWKEYGRQLRGAR